MSKDLHSNVRAKRVIAPVAIGANATKTGKVIDRQGYGGVEFVASYGAVTTTGTIVTLEDLVDAVGDEAVRGAVEQLAYRRDSSGVGGPSAVRAGVDATRATAAAGADALVEGAHRGPPSAASIAQHASRHRPAASPSVGP